MDGLIDVLLPLKVPFRPCIVLIGHHECYNFQEKGGINVIAR